MTNSGRMRFRASRVAMRRISCIDQQMSDDVFSAEADEASLFFAAMFLGAARMHWRERGS
jgi:hypothetical protein